MNIDYSHKKPHKDLNIPETITISFNGRNYSGHYIETGIMKDMSYESYKYECDNGVVFGVKKNGEFSYIILVNKEYFENQPLLPDLNNGELEAVRKKILAVVSDYIDTSEYLMESLAPSEYKSVTSYGYRFYKTIDGLKTTDETVIKYNSKGTITSFFVGDNGAFEKQLNIFRA